LMSSHILSRVGAAAPPDDHGRRERSEGDERRRLSYVGRMTRRTLVLPLLLALTGCPQAHTLAGPDSSPASTPAPAARAEPPATPPTKAEPAASVKTKMGTHHASCASTSACEKGLTCTVETGACDKPPGCGPGDMCAAVCYGVCAEASAASEPSEGCRSDDDCRTFSNYCGGCGCEGLLTEDPDPKCGGKLVNCVMNPCRGKKARCMEGSCVLRDSEM
jgi:hypothetical protein